MRRSSVDRSVAEELMDRCLIILLLPVSYFPAETTSLPAGWYQHDKKLTDVRFTYFIAEKVV